MVLQLENDILKKAKTGAGEPLDACKDVSTGSECVYQGYYENGLDILVTYGA